MYEKIIREIIERCWAKYGAPPSKIAVTQLFHTALKHEIIGLEYNADPTGQRDLLFGGVTRVYVSTGSTHMNRMMNIPEHVIAWEVSLGQH